MYALLVRRFFCTSYRRIPNLDLWQERSQRIGLLGFLPCSVISLRDWLPDLITSLYSSSIRLDQLRSALTHADYRVIIPQPSDEADAVVTGPEDNEEAEVKELTRRVSLVDDEKQKNNRTTCIDQHVEAKYKLSRKNVVNEGADNSYTLKRTAYPH